jgi:putative aldouronate transport system permease protein
LPRSPPRLARSSGRSPGKGYFSQMKIRSSSLYYISMLIPGVALLLIFSVVPMGGIVMAFQKYAPAKGIFGSAFVGLNNFRVLFRQPNFTQIINNTLIIATSKLALNIAVPVVFALLLNECRIRLLKRLIQTVVYLPNFLSWVIVAAMFLNMFSLSGVFNSLVKLFGQEPIIFMASNAWIRPIIIFTDTWKTFGFSAVVYISAITGIDPNLYESASIDGANRLQRMLRITMPGIMPTVVLMSTLALGNVLNAGFDQILNMYNPAVYQAADVLDTFTYRTAFGIGNVSVQRFDLATAVGLFKSAISFVLIVVSYWLANKFADYTIF